MHESADKLLKHFLAHGCHRGCEINREAIRAAFREIRNEALEEAINSVWKTGQNTQFSEIARICGDIEQLKCCAEQTSDV